MGLVVDNDVTVPECTVQPVDQSLAGRCVSVRESP